MQNSAGAGKAAKFVDANPLAPMADPFEGLNNDEKEYQKELSNNLNARLERTIKGMQDRQANGTSQADHPDRAPTGSAYKAHAQMQKERMAEERRRMDETGRLKALKEEAKIVFKEKNRDEKEEESEDDSDDDEYDNLLDDDAELEAIRARRISQMKEMQAQTARHKALGHGELRTILQDEFLPECTGGSEWVAVHFFHKEFKRCEIMDHHLKIVAPRHLGCKFLRLDVEKSPFFVSKLQIKTLPTLIVFREGKAIDRLTGFEGLAPDASEPDKWHTGSLQQWIATTGAIKYKVPDEEIREEMRRMGIRPKGTIWSGTAARGFKGDAYDSDDE